MRVLVCGGRDYNDWARLEDELNVIERTYGKLTIISGCARGADTLAIRYAEKYNDPVEKFPADWEKHGRGAGHIRNQQMLDEGKPDLVVAFPGGRGTANMIERARKAGVEVIQIEE
jgi:UDP-N-acetylmuramoylalanine-D-glutamate ligase